MDFVDNGDFFGELSVIQAEPAPEYIIAVAPSRVAFLSTAIVGKGDVLHAAGRGGR